MSVCRTIVQVKNVRSFNPKGFGGCIFSGRSIDTRGDLVDRRSLYVVRASSKVIGHTRVQAGQWWEVAGVPIEETRVVDNFSLKEWQIEATSVVPLRVSGHHIVTLLAESDEFSGIGVAKAWKLWHAFGEELYAVLDSGDTEKLQRVLTKSSAVQVIESWSAYRDTLGLHRLHAHGFDLSLCKQVIQFFGQETFRKIEEDPYRLLSFGAKWLRVDLFAKSRFDIDDDDPRRVQGAIEEALYRMYAVGHTAATLTTLEPYLESVFAGSAVRATWKRTVNGVINSGASNGSYVIKDNSTIHSIGPYALELTVANAISARMRDGSGSALLPRAQVEELIAEHQAQLSYALTDEQRQAIHLAANNRVALVTGGAGVGKTTVLQTLYKVYDAAGVRIYQVALAGRAAQRMKEATGRPASTIASLLITIRDKDLTGSAVIVVDEASMVDIVTMARLCEVLPSHVRLVLTGDPFQLMPIGPGLVLHVLAKIPDIPHIELSVVKRYGGEIAKAARSIRVGTWPELPNAPSASISFLPCPARDIATSVVTLLNSSNKDTQVLVCRRSGLGGVRLINEACQKRFTSSGSALMTWNYQHGMETHSGFFLNDQVICTRNRWDLGLQNGSMGRLVEVDGTELHEANANEPGRVIGVIAWDDGVNRPLTLDQMSDIELGYAITVHKAQGSQWHTVIIVLSKNRILDRTLVYTAVTRARSKVILLGDMDAARAAVEAAPRASLRETSLAGHFAVRNW